MKRRTALCALTLVPAAALADTAALQKIFENIARRRTLCAAFEMERSVPGLQQPFVSRGRVTIVEGLGLVWRTIQPIEDVIAYGGRSAAKTGDDGQIHISPSKESHIFTEQSEAVLSGNLFSLTNRFFADARVNADGSWLLILTPKMELIASLMSECLLTGAGTIKTAAFYRPDGTVIRIRFDEKRDSVLPLDDVELLYKLQ